jgi:small subunit ribosomal protein S9
MATKKKEVKKKKEVEAKPRSVPKIEHYIGAVGRRKTSIARVRIIEAKEISFSVNEKDVKIYFPLAELREIAMSPLSVSGKEVTFSVSVKVNGGGIRGQAEAIRLGLSRALVSFSENFKKPLRTLGYLTRDSRIVERKKAGLKKARRAPQWQKR